MEEAAISSKSDGYFSIRTLCSEEASHHEPQVESSKKRSKETLRKQTKDQSEAASQENKETFHEFHRLARVFMKHLLLNIEGFKKYEQNEYEEALQLFQEAAEVDPININALQNCRFVYKELNMQADAVEMSIRIDALLAREDAQVIKARTLAEIGLAVLPVTENYNYAFVNKRLHRAIELAEENVNKGDLAFWKLSLPIKLHKQHQEETDVEKSKRLHLRSIEWFCDVANSESSPNEIKAQALCKLRKCLQHPERGAEYVEESLHQAINESGVLGRLLNPEDYFQEAYARDKESPTVCNRYASFLICSEHLDEAQDMIDKTFAAVDEHHQFLAAYSTRGELLMKLYRKHKEKTYLKQAIQNLSSYSKFISSDRAVHQLGLAYYLLVMHDEPSYIHSDDIKYALVCFDRYVELSGDTPHSQTHFDHAKCLADFGYLRLAIESSKQTVEKHACQDTFFAYSLMKLLFQLYRNEGRPDHIMSECMYWLNLSCTKYKDIPDQLCQTLGQLHSINKLTMVRLYHNLLHNGYDETAGLFDRLIPNFSTYCCHPPKDHIPPPAPRAAYNQLRKDFNFVVLHSESDRPWIYYSLLTKLEMQHKMKGYVVGRDMERDILVVTEKSICVIIVMTKAVLQSVWFCDNRPCDLLRKVTDTHKNVIALIRDEELSNCCDQFFSGTSVKKFECCDYVPWQALSKHIKECCGDSPEDLSTLQAFDDVLAESAN